MSKKKKPKIQDLTGGAYQPSEQFKQVSDGTVVRLEDPTTPKEPEEAVIIEDPIIIEAETVEEPEKGEDKDPSSDDSE